MMRRSRRSSEKSLARALCLSLSPSPPNFVHAMIFAEICRIAMPTADERVVSLQWSHRHDWLAIGGSSGSLQVLKHQWIAGRNEPNRAVVAGLGITYKQSCLGHYGETWRRECTVAFLQRAPGVQFAKIRAGQVQLSAWNDAFEKIASFDSEGTIIIWQFNGDKFVEIELTHRCSATSCSMSTDTRLCRRSGHIATEFEWSPDGLMACVAYKDGASRWCAPR
jgi:hypothetical protein